MGLTSQNPSKGAIWLVNLDPSIGHEQKGTRPALIISEDLFNATPADMVIVLPITSKNKGISLHVPVKQLETGLKVKSYVKTEDIRAISKKRLYKPIGSVSHETLIRINDLLRLILGL